MYRSPWEQFSPSGRWPRSFPFLFLNSLTVYLTTVKKKIGAMYVRFLWYNEFDDVAPLVLWLGYLSCMVRCKFVYGIPCKGA